VKTIPDSIPAVHHRRRDPDAIRRPHRFAQIVLLAGIVSLALLTFGTTAQATVLMTEDFNYTSGAYLTNTVNGGGANWSIITADAGTTPPVIASGLTLSGYTGAGVGNAVSLATSGEDDRRTFTAQTANGSTYAVFLVNVSSAQTSGDHFFSLSDASTSPAFKAPVWIKRDATVTTAFGFGLSKTSSGAVTYESTTARSIGTTYLVVLKYTIVNGTAGTDDTVSLFVSPTLGAVEPGTPTIGPFSNAEADIAAGGIAQVNLRQGASSSAAAVKVDGIIIATTWAEVVPTPPSISSQPANAAACAGSTAEFSVTATNSPSYSWAKRGGGWGSSWTKTTASGGTTFRSSSTDNDSGDPACTSFTQNDINSASGNALGIYGGTSGDTTLTRTFNALTAGQAVSIDMDNGDVESGKKVGFSLETPAGADVLQFYFLGGQSNYKFNDGTERDTGIPFQRTGVRVQFMLTSSTTYTLAVTPCGGSTSYFNYAYSGSIAKLKLFNQNATGGNNHNAYFNRFIIGGYVDDADSYAGDPNGFDAGEQAIASGNGSSTYTSPTLVIGDNGNKYEVVVYNNAGVSLSSVATLTVQANSAAPVVGAPICAGATNVSGTSSEADGTTIDVLVDNSSVGTTTVSSGVWTKTGLTALTAGRVVTAKATASGKCQSTASSGVTVSPGPTIACPSDISTSTDAGLCTASLTFSPTFTGTLECKIGATVITSPHAFDVGTNTVSCTASNDCGTTNCTFQVIVNDTQAPSIGCPSTVTVSTDSGLCTASGVNLGVPSTNDNCGVATVVNNAAASYPVGTNAVIWTVTDIHGNSATCTQQVIVVDNQKPTINCPTNIVTSADPGQCSKSNVTYTATATDNCTNVTVSCTPASGSTFAIGTNSVSCTAIDGSGNTNSCKFTVTLVDDEPPVVSCPTNIVTSVDPGQCAKSNVTYSATASDNCTNVTLSYNPPSGSTFPIGTTTVYVNATDASGNSAAITVFGDINTDAGNGSAGYSGDGGAATSARLNSPYQVAVDSSGNLFIADLNNQRIRRVDAATGIITTVAGDGSAGYSGDGGAATNASLQYPTAVALDRSGNLFISDYGNARIRRVDAATGIITTVAGSGSAGYSGDGGAATNASLKFTYGVVLDRAGNLFIADEGNDRIRRVDAATGIITTVAGNGSIGYSGDGGAATNAKLDGPFNVALDRAGNLFIADFYNARIRRVDVATGIITTVAGNGSAGYSGDGGAATNTKLFGPFGVTLDRAGNLFIADWFNYRVRRVDAGTGIITTVAGNGSSGYSGDGGAATNARLTDPTGVELDRAGNLFIADLNGQRVRRVDAVAACTFTVTVNDTEPPSIICPTNLTVSCASEVPAPDTNSVSAVDSCSAATVSFEGDVISDQTCANRYTVTRTYKATDESGNTNTCQQIITVDGETPPTFASCPTNVVTSADLGQCSKSNMTWIVSASDICGTNPVVVCTPPTGSTFAVNATTVRCTATDSCGNTSSCSFTVTVNDTELPVISTCANSQTLSANGSCQAALPDLTSEVVVTDNCGGTPTVTQSPAAGTLLGLGTNLVVWTATDTHGNSASCTQQVIVATVTIDSSDFGIVGIEAIGDDINLTWQTFGNTTNVIQLATPIINGNYTNNYINLDIVIVPGSGAVITNWVDYGGATNGPSRFYRIRLQPGASCGP
jgi:sugar lactone lactonase YvrE